jgi:hypothetical protein
MPCGGGVEYLHRSPASRRDSDMRMTALARISSNCKRQTHHLVREDVNKGYNRKCSVGK